MSILKTAALLVALAVSPAGAQAQRYPERMITMVVPFGAGASTDVATRTLARALSEEVKQPVIVENRPGVDGLVGLQTFARAAPDGYSVLISSGSTFVLNPHLYKSLPYDPVKDFIPITMLYRGIQVLVVGGDSRIRTIQQLIETARANPGKLSFGASTATTRLAIELMQQIAGVKLLYVPYKAVGPYLADLMSGTIDLASADVQSLRSLIESGKLRALGVSSTNRHYLLPNVPTVEESGVKGYEFSYWVGTWLPGGAPGPVVTRLHELLYKVVKTPEMRKFITDGGAELVDYSLLELAALQAAELEKFGRVIRGAGIQPQ